MLLKLCYSIKKLGKDPSSFISSLADRENYCERNERTVSQSVFTVFAVCSYDAELAWTASVRERDVWMNQQQTKDVHRHICIFSVMGAREWSRDGELSIANPTRGGTWIRTTSISRPLCRRLMADIQCETETELYWAMLYHVWMVRLGRSHVGVICYSCQRARMPGRLCMATISQQLPEIERLRWPPR